MKHGIIIVLFSVVILALILALKAFFMVFGLIIYYGAMAVCIAFVLYIYYIIKRGRKKEKDL
jgi:Ca2+/Na+ antiporter